MCDRKIVQEVNYICAKRDGIETTETNLLLQEHSMKILVNEEYVLDVMCTPQYIEELILGRLLTEGMIRSEEDIWELQISTDKKIAKVVIGRDSIDDQLWQIHSIVCSNEQIFAMADKMAEGMPLHEATWGTHSCFLFRDGMLLFECEDLGRHNAMDKVIGYALKNEVNLKKCAIYSSGRVPSDMAEKAIRAGIPILASKGVPTADAVEMAKTYGLTLVCGTRRDQMKIYTDFRKIGIDALILAGGKSSRMGGKHKGNLKIGGETFTQHLISEVTKSVDNVWISYGTEIHEKYENCKIITDHYKECGPMGGIHAGLTAAASEYLFVVACDMPFMKAEFVEELKKHLSENADVIVPVINGRPQPLATLYKKTVLPVLEEKLAEGNYKLRSIFEHVKVSYVEIEAQWEPVLRNINTTEEYQEIQRS